MTMRQEAVQLIEQQPDINLKAIIELLKALPKRKIRYKKVLLSPGHGLVKLSDDYINHFDDDNEDIANMFCAEDEWNTY